MNLVHIYCGDGKGKTTAAMGLIIRALGRGKRVVLVQFLKGWETGELMFLKDAQNLHVLRFDELKKFTFNMDLGELEELLQKNNALLKNALEIPCDMLVLDEAMSAYNGGHLEKNLLREVVLQRKCEIVLTGRDPDEFFLENADYVTQMTGIKHPYDKGVLAREGIEY